MFRLMLWEIMTHVGQQGCEQELVMTVLWGGGSWANIRTNNEVSQGKMLKQKMTHVSFGLRHINSCY